MSNFVSEELVLAWKRQFKLAIPTDARLHAHDLGSHGLIALNQSGAILDCLLWQGMLKPCFEGEIVAEFIDEARFHKGWKLTREQVVNHVKANADTYARLVSDYKLNFCPDWLVPVCVEVLMFCVNDPMGWVARADELRAELDTRCADKSPSTR